MKDTIYGLADRREPSRIRYIGHTSCRFNIRLNHHLSQARCGRRVQPALMDWLLSLPDRPLVINLTALEDLTELQWINKIGKDLLNIDPFNRRRSWTKHSEEYITKKKSRR